ncbi:MAG: response regulator, partial [Phycisphaeraceae bacterium]
ALHHPPPLSDCLLIDPGPLESACWLDNWGEAMQGFGAGARPAKVHALHGRILLVDDGVDNRQLLSVYLRQAGASVTLAKNGQIGCHKALSAMARGKPFNMILMDMQMPVLDGYGATARLRAKGYAGPIVALTAHAMTEDRARCIQAGCTDYLSKPIRRDELLMALSRYLPSTTADDEADLDADAPAHEPPPPEATSLSGTSGGSSEGASHGAVG